MVPKFRAYIKDLDEFDYNDVPHKGHFVYGNLIKGKPNDDVDAIVGDLIEVTDEYINPEWWCSIEKGSAEQFTGLKDVNGDMIYENDIIKYFGGNERVKIKTTYGIVFYDSEHGCFNSRIQNEEHNKGGISPLDDLIVGNVHTNPELLEAQHDTRTD
ncbi:YopX family protein [Levilactobacillus brevis]|uniref:YopX family protein n=1 Tax=Levilactobacillus brevis TaxID=1580 RepID=UPI001F29ED83|nr:YopX family protein [Levilactobacillus brevis]